MKTHPSRPVACCLVSACILAALVSSAPVLHATVYTWVPTTGGAWDTATANWNDGTTNTTWGDGSGNSVVFNGFSAAATVTQSANWTLSSLTLNSTGGTSTLTLNGGKSLDVSSITTASAAIDMYSKLTGSHGLTYTSTGGGRLNLKVANDYTGNTTLTGSAYILSDTVNNALPTATTLDIGSSATFRLTNSKSQQIGLLTGSGTVVSQASAAGNVNTLTINTANGANGTFSGTIKVNNTANDTLNLTVSGLGTQILTGTNSYNGATLISGGTLSLGSNLSATSSVTISGGTLTSTVANVKLGVGGASMSAGTITPGGTGTVGTLTLAASQAFATTGGTLNFDLLGSSSFDQIISLGSGAFSLTDTTLALSGLTSVTGTYQLFSGFTSGSVSGLTISGLADGFAGSLDTTGLLTVSAIPEPSTYAVLAGTAFLGFAVMYRRPVRR
ncbi:MAG: autotransporter-associated beta strand repeat-containing protein [Opitutaceae bacterium]|jgi:autotransporter-associated beta strand protein